MNERPAPHVRTDGATAKRGASALPSRQKRLKASGVETVKPDFPNFKTLMFSIFAAMLGLLAIWVHAFHNSPAVSS